jgi:GNAT superfamily N-acetyltransferase
MLVQLAQAEDIPSWLGLAAEVESLFGPMLDNPDFHCALERSIERRNAFCVREADGPPGTGLMGGLLFSAKHAPLYKINWLSVAQRCRRHGVGRLLITHTFSLIQPPAEMSVVTFGFDSIAGQPARRLYESMGFRAAETAPDGPEGGSRRVYRRGFE